MAAFTSKHESTHTLRSAPDDALAAWADPERQTRCHAEVARSEVPAPGQLRLVLKEMKYGPSALAGDYTLSWGKGAGPPSRYAAIIPIKCG